MADVVRLPNGKLDQEIRGLDNLELPLRPGVDRLRGLWSGLWPKVAAVAIVLLVWQIVVWAQLRPEYVLPGPPERMMPLGLKLRIASASKS